MVPRSGRRSGRRQCQNSSLTGRRPPPRPRRPVRSSPPSSGLCRPCSPLREELAGRSRRRPTRQQVLLSGGTIPEMRAPRSTDVPWLRHGVADAVAPRVDAWREHGGPASRSRGAGGEASAQSQKRPPHRRLDSRPCESPSPGEQSHRTSLDPKGFAPAPIRALRAPSRWGRDRQK